MEIKFIDLVDDFYETIKDKYEINREELRLVLKSPFLHLREIISSDKCEEIRLKYLGVFRIHKQSVRKLLAVNQTKFDNRTITEDDYIRVKTKLSNRLKEKDDNSEEDL